MKSVRRSTVQIALAMILVFLGWAIGRAQTSVPVFELVVDAPGGETTIRCVRGCRLAWVERGVNPNAAPISTFTYHCTASRCSSARVRGWLTP